MPVYFTINQNNTFNLEIKEDKELYREKESVIFKDILKNINLLKKLHGSNITSRGRIIGQDRIKYVALLDNILMLLVSLYKNLSGPSREFAVEPAEPNLKIPFKSKNYKTIARGKINQKDLEQIVSFASFLDEKVIINIKTLLSSYKTYNETTDNEMIKKIITVFDTIIYNILLIRNSIEICSIDQ